MAKAWNNIRGKKSQLENAIVMVDGYFLSVGEPGIYCSKKGLEAWEFLLDKGILASRTESIKTTEWSDEKEEVYYLYLTPGAEERIETLRDVLEL